MHTPTWTVGHEAAEIRHRGAAHHHWMSRVRTLANWLDTAWRVPGTNFRLGADSLIGLVPAAGDVVSATLSGYLLWEAHRHGASRWTLTRMAGNILVDASLGSVPIVGDFFDVMWKANQRNMRLLEREFLSPSAALSRHRERVNPRQEVAEH